MSMTKEERRLKRQKRMKSQKDDDDSEKTNSQNEFTDGKTAALLMQNEDKLLEFVAGVNKVYQENLNKPAPFMTFVICGNQSTGKSTIMERFMGSVINIVQEGTGTRCPLDTTCIHDDECEEAQCDLSGTELENGGTGRNLSLKDVFERIVSHNRRLSNEDRFSTEPLRLIFRSKHVQNMRFVDTPGIIATKGQGHDNREDIKNILRSEISKPNTKLCVLLEPKEFSTNSIIDFCDDTFGGRNEWVNDATFLMTKFDKQFEDSRSGSKANKFFKEFEENSINPYLVFTPTLAKEDLPAEELYEQRQNILDTADQKEKDRFSSWNDTHQRFLQENPTDELLSDDTKNRIGFLSAKKLMREIMLNDTVERLPEVLSSLRMDLSQREEEANIISEKLKFNEAANLKIVVSELLVQINKKMLKYLDGDLTSSIKFPKKLQTLEQEIDQEEESEWSEKGLNHYSEAEDSWRDKIEAFHGEFPNEIQPNKRFLGGKQVQRALGFFSTVLIASLPDPSVLKEFVPNATGYLGDGLQHENWEGAIVEIIKTCLKEVSHPGINYLIKHIGNIFRRLFLVALDDIKKGERHSKTFKLLPDSIENYLVKDFDEMLWKLMEKASEQTHSSMEPMYSTVNPNLPTFISNRMQEDDEKDLYEMKDGNFVKRPKSAETEEIGMVEMFQNRMKAVVSGSGDAAKDVLKRDHESRAKKKKSFLPDMRTSMITDDETDIIIRRSFEYIVGLMEFNLINLQFMINHFLVIGFKSQLDYYPSRIINEAPWDNLVTQDTRLSTRLSELNSQIDVLKKSLQDVGRMQRDV